MAYQCLADFLEELGQAGELVRVETEVDPLLEAAEITGRVVTSGGPAILFGSVSGHDLPLLTNLLGTESRICRALRIRSPADLAQRIADFVDPPSPDGWFERLKTAPTRSALEKLLPRSVKSGPCQQIVRLGGDVDLGELPVLQSWPLEPGRTITAGQVFTTDPATGRAVVCRHDLQVLDRRRLAIHWGPHELPARLLAEYHQRRQRMPLAVVLGGDPACLLAAVAPLPAEADGRALAGLFRGKPLELVACRSQELEVPAEAEIVVEGSIDPFEPPCDAGPLCTPVGYYSRRGPAPVMHVAALTHRANPIYPAMLHGSPPHEICMIGRVLRRVFLPLVKLAIPEVADYDLPEYGAGRHWLLVSIRKTYAGQARRVAQAVWGLPLLMCSKFLVVVDDDLDIRDQGQVWSRVATRVDPARDVFFQEGPPDPWDPAAPAGTLACRMAIDATAKLPDEGRAHISQPATMSEEVRRLVSGRWNQYGLGPGDI